MDAGRLVHDFDQRYARMLQRFDAPTDSGLQKSVWESVDHGKVLHFWMVYEQVDVWLWQIQTGGTGAKHHYDGLRIVLFNYLLHFLNQVLPLQPLLIRLLYPRDKVEYFVVEEGEDLFTPKRFIWEPGIFLLSVILGLYAIV